MDICVVQHLIVGGGIMIVYSRIQGCRRTTIVIINGNLNGVLHRDEILQQHHIPFIKETCHHISEGQCQSTRYTCLDQYAAMTCHFARPICQQQSTHGMKWNGVLEICQINRKWWQKQTQHQLGFVMIFNQIVHTRRFNEIYQQRYKNLK